MARDLRMFYVRSGDVCRRVVSFVDDDPAEILAHAPIRGEVVSADEYESRVETAERIWWPDGGCVMRLPADHA